MARIRPFRGLRYDPGKTPDVASVMAPPYDVVDAPRRAALAEASEANCIHFILPEGDADTKYPRGGASFRSIVETAMLRDDEPAIYVYHQKFSIGGETFVRKGFVCLIELTRFGSGPVLGHERTLAGPKADRLNLMRACEAHLELVFGMFSDPERGWETIVDPHRTRPLFTAQFEDVTHSLWKVDDPDALAALGKRLEDRSIYIADGHHRYETMCAFAEELQGRGHPRGAYGMIYLSNLDDPGLLVLPTHRLVHGIDAVELPTVVSTLAPFFDHDEQPLPTSVAAMTEALAAPDGRATFGLSVPKSGVLHRLVLRADFDPAAAGLGEMAEALQRLDVALLHELVLERALGITKAAQEAKTNLRYFKSSQASLDVARDGDDKTQLVCFMNATPVADVRAVCDSGEVMPQKSTFFYPKIPNGLVFYDLSAD